MISVIIIFLDAAPFIREAIDSVYNQTCPDWELILVDDGSQDGSSELAIAYSRNDSARVHYMDHPGHRKLGTSASRNAGLCEARGKYVLYLDADDILLPNALGDMAAVLNSRPELAAVMGATMYWYWDELYSHTDDVVQRYGAWSGQVALPPDFFVAMTRNEELHPANCSTLLRRNAMLDIGGFEASFRGMYEDTVLLAKLLLSYKVYVTGEVFSAYRMHHASQCHRAAADGEFNNFEPNRSRHAYLLWLRDYVRRHQVETPALRRALDRQLWPYDKSLMGFIIRQPLAQKVVGGVKRWGRHVRRLCSPAFAPSEAPSRPADQAEVEILGQLRAFYETTGRRLQAEAVGRREITRAGALKAT